MDDRTLTSRPVDDGPPTAGLEPARRGSWINGRDVQSAAHVVVRAPHRDVVVSLVAEPDADQVEEAVTSSLAAQPALRSMTSGQRADGLRAVAILLDERAPTLAAQITDETGKPITWSRTEVARTAAILRIAAEEAVRFNPEAQRLDGQPSGAGRMALTKRRPYGTVLAISPFNFPLHLVAHKVGPALAVGAPVIIKPSPKAPLSSLSLAELVTEAGFPDGSLNVLLATDVELQRLVDDPRLPVISFTGYDAVGWSIVDRVPRKQVITELGGNAAVLIAPDHTSEAQLVHAADRVALFSNYHAGQACTSPQRVLVPRAHLDEFAAALVRSTEAQVVGDPDDPATDVGPLIDDDAVERVAAWIDEAVSAGARVLTGGRRDGAWYAPTVLVDVPRDTRLYQDEVFGPVVRIEGYDDVDHAMATINESRFGLQVGVFTHDLALAFRSLDVLEAGGIVIGDVPTSRSDYAPFGGTKSSGQGREGVRSAMDSFTEPRTLTLTGIAL